MDKFEKKIRKSVKTPENAIVVGNGFGHLESILSAHNTAFIIDAKDQSLKTKNAIYREDFEYMNLLYDVKVIYFDLDKIHLLEKLQNFWTQHRCYVIIEGGEPIGRKHSGPLYASGWGCTIVEKNFHVWEKIK